jgi:hypothetical protein
MGYRNVEEIRAGDLIFSRSEHDPSGPIEAKVVEEVFERFAGVYNLHIGGQVIGTSGEHPFYVEGKGWTKAFELQPGDRVATADGVGVLVEEVWDTGEWELVYNLRVADHHTYFVGDESWGWAAWAHNVYMRAGTGDSFEVYNLGDGPSADFSKMVSVGKVTAAKARAMVTNGNASQNLGTQKNVYTVSEVPINLNRIGTGYGLTSSSSTAALGGTWTGISDIITGSTTEPPDTTTQVQYNPLELHIEANIRMYWNSGEYVYSISMPEKAVYQDPHAPNSAYARWSPAEVPGAQIVSIWKIHRKDQNTPAGPMLRLWLTPE